jgi:hypothetical protein
LQEAEPFLVFFDNGVVTHFSFTRRLAINMQRLMAQGGKFGLRSCG